MFAMGICEASRFLEIHESSVHITGQVTLTGFAVIMCRRVYEIVKILITNV